MQKDRRIQSRILMWRDQVWNNQRILTFLRILKKITKWVIPGVVQTALDMSLLILETFPNYPLKNCINKTSILNSNLRNLRINSCQKLQPLRRRFNIMYRLTKNFNNFYKMWHLSKKRMTIIMSSTLIFYPCQLKNSSKVFSRTRHLWTFFNTIQILSLLETSLSRILLSQMTAS